jgi:GNAT superfamily N-acetyltransferase
MINYEQTSRLADAILAKGMLDSLENYYPGFQYWYVNACMPGIIAGPDVLIVAKEHDQIVGVALGKNRDTEKKLRCVRVLESHQNKGTGLKLIDGVLRALDCDKPTCSVSEEMLGLYSRAFVNRYGFDLTKVEKGMYRERKLEYVFNEGAIGDSDDYLDGLYDLDDAAERADYARRSVCLI